MMKQKLIDVFSDPLTNGIFKYIQDISPSVPWAQDMDAATLDLEYIGNISGQKTISPLIKNVLLKDSTTGVLTDTQILQLATTVYKMFYLEWEKEYNTFSLEYNPISNYDMTETETTENDRTNTTANTGTRTVAGSGSVNGTTSSQTDNNVYGFNSSVAVGDTENNISASNTTTSTDSHTTTDNLTETETGDETIERTLTRSGNIGVTTSQQMIESERELWLWNFFYNVVFPNVDRVLTLETYRR